MTLILAWQTTAGACVVADTRIGSDHSIITDVGPKIFVLPITLNRWIDGQSEPARTSRPALGFAFSWNTLSAQSTHAVVATCVQNLVALDGDEAPTVQDVAEFYARCGAMIVNERRTHEAMDSFRFSGLVFGRSTEHGASEVFEVDIRIDEQGTAVGECEQIIIDKGRPLYLLGSGAAAAMKVVYEIADSGEVVKPGEVLNRIILDPTLRSVGGGFQCALATDTGVALRPTFRIDQETGAISLSVLGINLADLGSVGLHSPTSTFAFV